MREKIKVLIRVVCFIILLVFMFSKVNQVLMRKSISGAWNMTIKTNGFYNEAEDRFDVMGFGSSHMYCTVNPLALWEAEGIPSYLLTSQQQPPCVTYYYIKEALKTQTPKVVLLETYMFTFPSGNYDEGVFHDAIDFLKPSKNRIDLIKELVPKEERKNYYFPFLKYHTRWEELTDKDFDNSYLEKKDWLKGYVFLKEGKPQSIDSTIAKSEIRNPIPEENLKYLNKIVQLSKEKNFKLVFISAPYSVTEEEQGVLNSIGDFAGENGIDFIDFNKLFDDIQLDDETDFFDGGHTNAYGADKVTKYLAKYLKDNYGLKSYFSDKNYLDFEENLEKYNSEM